MLARFLGVIIPEAEKLGVRMAIHPDDPPFSVLGLPRIVSTAAHLDAIVAMADSPANGICFCTGSLGARPDKDLPAIPAALLDEQSRRSADDPIPFRPDHGHVMMDGLAELRGLMLGLRRNVP